MFLSHFCQVRQGGIALGNLLRVFGFGVLVIVVAGGAQCVGVVKSGGDIRDDSLRDSRVVVVFTSGRFDGPQVAGLRFAAGGRSGFTDDRGGFQFTEGDPVTFRVGEISLGREVHASARMTLLDLVPGSTVDTPEVINMTRFLISLDIEPDDGEPITIPREVDARAVAADPDAGPLLETLNFADQATFDSTAANLLAVLTDSYPFTVTLADALVARRRLLASKEGS